MSAKTKLNPNDLPPSQRRVLNFIEMFINEWGISPTIENIREGLGYRAPKSAREVVLALALKGFISYEPKIHRSIKLLVSSGAIIPGPHTQNPHLI